jgi:DNA replication and repair protein RecF
VNLSWLELGDFRCYDELSFRPDEGVNVLVGDNGAGKTSVLEAIAYLGLLRSFRGTADASLVRTDTEQAVVRGAFSRGGGEVKVEIALPAVGRRTVLMNGKRPARNRDVLAEVPVVAFLPDDLDLVKRGPVLRRQYLDDLAAQLKPQAGVDQADFDRALRQRNTLLRQEGRYADAATLDVWDERLAAAGSLVYSARRQARHRLQPHLDGGYKSVGGEGDVSWTYVTNWGAEEDTPEGEELEAVLLSALGAGRNHDMERRATSVGPHRDDPQLNLNGRSLRSQASQGEQRTAALALRVGAYRLLTDARPTRPVLLLDDVFSELDPGRVEGVLALLPEGQVFVTSAREDEIPVQGRRWAVDAGTIRDA